MSSRPGPRRRRNDETLRLQIRRTTGIRDSSCRSRRRQPHFPEPGSQMKKHRMPSMRDLPHPDQPPDSCTGKAGLARVAALLLGSSVLAGSLVVAAHSADPAFEAAGTPTTVGAIFAANGDVDLPVGYRRWSHVGTRIKTDGISILDGKPLTVPEIMNAYVEPSALAAFQATGKWPDGTQIVKEVSTILTGDGCDDVTRICSKPIGNGIFQDSYMGLGMMVKDEKRFPGSPGHWGYFSFGHKPPPYDATSPARAPEQCSSCHVNLASDTDYVISRAHLGLAGTFGH